MTSSMTLLLSSLLLLAAAPFVCLAPFCRACSCKQASTGGFSIEASGRGRRAFRGRQHLRLSRMPPSPAPLQSHGRGTWSRAIEMICRRHGSCPCLTKYGPIVDERPGCWRAARSLLRFFKLSPCSASLDLAHLSAPARSHSKHARTLARPHCRRACARTPLSLLLIVVCLSLCSTTPFACISHLFAFAPWHPPSLASPRTRTHNLPSFLPTQLGSYDLPSRQQYLAISSFRSVPITTLISSLL